MKSLSSLFPETYRPTQQCFGISLQWRKAGVIEQIQIFEVMGAIATDPEYGFDRYSRNLRSLTLDQPLAYKVREVGKWLLNQELPRTKA